MPDRRLWPRHLPQHDAPPAIGDDRSPDLRAGAFQGVRAARRSELAEDYVELIAELIHTQGEARPVDIATRMGVTAPTVAKTLATECRLRPGIVLRFLLSLRLDPETAERDAEGIEHHVSEKTLALLAAFVRRS